MQPRVIFFTLCLFVSFSAQAIPSGGKKDDTDTKRKISFDLNEQGTIAVKAKDFTRAENLFERALEADRGNLTAVFNLSGAYLANKKMELAIKLLNDYITNAPKEPALLVHLGDAYFASKKLDDALGSYEKAYALAPNYRGLPGKLGTLYALRNRLKDAEKAFSEAVDQEPKNVEFLTSLSSLYFANKKMDDAIAIAKKGIQLKPSKELYLNLGNAYEAIKDYKNSVIAFERAVDLGDTSAEVKAKLVELKKISS